MEKWKNLKCKYCDKIFELMEDVKMHEVNCKKNPDAKKHYVEKNDYVHPIRISGYNKIIKNNNST